MSNTNSTIDFNGKTVLITGGTGSFGRQFSETLLKRYKLRKLIILSRDEHKQYDMQQSAAFADREELRYFLGDVRDVDRLRMAMRGVDCVIHAAALKHVPAAEYNPFECIRTNVYGAENVISAAIDVGVEKVIALSTDKAVNPINIYGASKLASDKLFIAANTLAGDSATRFSVVRYGNVLGSRGSIVPLIRRLVEEGCDSIPLTDDRMTRFWITLDQGINFVLSSAKLMKGGEIFVPKVPSMTVVDMMEALAPGIPRQVVGIRPGEKLHELLISEDDTAAVVERDGRYVICPAQDPSVQASHEAEGAVVAPSDFHYASNTNEEWLDRDGLVKLLDQI
ncbi:MAG: UDP-N-acetylglucosamine 4,6-dehydratase (inverting) [Alphaproteobacteria bacterium]|nr:UDP-N-acetylglucosamine 4,6-dehydratase (inverting) [Alphaproteobacteria bacterium]